MEKMVKNKHFTVLGALYLGLGIMGLVGAAIVLTVFFLGSAALAVAATQDPDTPALAFLMPAGFGIFIASIVAITSIPNLIAAYGLLLSRGWAAVAALIVGIVNLPSFPLGTGVGVYAIWVYLQQDSSSPDRVNLP